MNSALTPEAIARICEHMNDDHADAVARYAIVYGKCADALGARIDAFDSRGMDLDVTTAEGNRMIHVAFDREITDAQDARATLIAMAQEPARSERPA
jgi:putative heme iron utilization protein